MMRAAIYNPYLDTLGGGERYTMTFAKALINNGYKVDVYWKDDKIRQTLEERFGINLQGINFVQDIKKGDGYDVCFWVSDGSIPLLHARRNILHFQIPFTEVKGKTLLNRMKFYRINKTVCNSVFTKKIVDKEYGIKSIVIYPPVPVDVIVPKRKINVILSVGRFSQLTQAKRQDVLVDTFIKMYKKGLRDWKLIFAGGSEVGTEGFLKILKEKSEGYPIEIYESPNFKKLKELYGVSKIFWTASGFGVNESKEPKKVEHFGISIVEAMAAKSVVFAYDSGGHKEIIKNGTNGFLWKTENELVKNTLNIIKNTTMLNEIARNGKVRSSDFGYDRFNIQIKKLL